MPRQDKEIETSGGDYTSAAAFEADADTMHTTADPWRALCGKLNIGKSEPVGFTVPPILGSELIYEAAVGAKQDGDPTNTNVARVIGVSNTQILFARVTFVTYDGLRVESPATISAGGTTFGVRGQPAATGLTVQNCFFHVKTTSGVQLYVPYALDTSGAGTVTDLTFINNIVFVDPLNVSDCREVRLLQNGDGGSLQAKRVSYNTLVAASGASGLRGFLIQTVGTPDCVIDEFDGNRVHGYSQDYLLSGSPILTAADFNVSSDATALGNNPIINKTALESFVDENKDFRLLAGAPGAGVSTNRDGVPALTTDNQGLARPAGEPWDAGALQVAAAAVNLADERVRNRRFVPGYKPWLIHRQGAVG